MKSIKSILSGLLDRAIRYKTYLDRARGYIGYFQFAVMLLVMLKVYDETTWGMWLFAHKLVLAGLIVVLFGIFIIIGYIDRRYIKPKEIIELQKADPMFMAMKKKVNDIHDKLCK
jgi:hypothetical protein